MGYAVIILIAVCVLAWGNITEAIPAARGNKSIAKR